MLMFHLDGRYLKEAEREARKTGRGLVGDAVSQQFSNVITQWSTEVKERQLVTAVRRGDRDAFLGLLEPYWRKLENLCYRLVNRQREDAQDLMQEALLKAWDKFDTFNPDKKFGPWLFRIAVNTHIDMIRHQKRAYEYFGWIVSLDKPIGSDEADEDGEILLIDQFPGDTRDIADEVILRETFKKCWPALTRDEQMVLLFIYGWDGTFKELGWLKGSMNIDPGDDKETIKRKRQSAHQNGRYHVKKALLKLKEHLQKEGFDCIDLDRIDHSRLSQLLDDEEQKTEGGTIQ